jgi:hypothetical protein
VFHALATPASAGGAGYRTFSKYQAAHLALREGYRAMAIALPTYGADRSAMVCGFVFAPGVPGRPVSASDALEWLARGASATGSEFLWLHFNLSIAATEKWMGDHLALSEAFREALRDGLSMIIETRAGFPSLPTIRRRS